MLFSGAPLSEGRHLAAVSPDLILCEAALGGERRGTVALYRSRRFAIDDAGSADRPEQLHLLGDTILFLDIAVEQQAGEPATAHTHLVLLQDGAQYLHPSGSAGRSPCQ